MDLPISKQKCDKRWLEFDIIRALAVIYIIGVRHLDDYFIIPGSRSRTLALLDDTITYIALGLFVFTSGYLLSHRYPTLENRKDIRDFLRARILRIYPLYLVTLAGFAVYYSGAGVKNVLAHSLCLNMLLSPWSGESFKTIWFISLIILFYFAYVVLARLRRWRLILGFAAFMSVFLFVNLALGITDDRLFIYFPMFVVGIGAQRANLLSHLSSKLACCSFLALLVSVWLYYLAPNSTIFVAGLVQNLLMLAAIIPVLWIAKLFSAAVGIYSFFKTVSYASFAMYLLHRFVYRFLLLLYYPDSNTGVLLYLALIGVPLTYLFGFVIQKSYDYILKSTMLMKMQNSLFARNS